jgi:WD40 repeat protein/serine/threonine protein kinase/Tfp pilus assembly protein PilF
MNHGQTSMNTPTPNPGAGSLPDSSPTLPPAAPAEAATEGDGLDWSIAGDHLPVVPGFVIERELGRGGMGIVYKARQITVNRTVALKMILAGEFAGPNQRSRFRAEAQAVAALDHPNIVRLFDLGEHGKILYLTLEYIDGDRLDRKLNATPLPATEAATLVATLAKAMVYAHERGIIHRDLKPENVMLSADGSPKILDFGLAKQMDTDARHTKSGAIVGTPSYMAPEQAAGLKNIGPLVDVYALGAMLYELLTGRPPFRAATPMDTVLQVITEEPVAPSRLTGQVPRDLETICLKCLRKEPAKRYANASALAADLERYLNGKPIVARPIGPLGRLHRWSRRNPLIATLSSTIALLLILATTVAIAASFKFLALANQERKARDEADALAEQNRQTMVRLQVDNGTRELSVGNPAGAMVWFTAALERDHRDAERAHLHRIRLATVLNQCIRRAQVWFHDGPINDVAFNVDGTLAATAGDDGTARIWVVATGQPATKPLTQPGKVRGVEFSRDGKRLLTHGSDSLARIWDTETGNLVAELPAHHGAVGAACFSPDGRNVLCGGIDGVLNKVSIDGAVLWTTKLSRSIKQVAFSPDGRQFAVVALSNVVRLGSSDTGEIVHTLNHAAVMEHAAFSPDGQRLATCGNNERPAVWDTATGQRKQSFEMSNGGKSRVAFSPDGRRVVVASWDQFARQFDLVGGRAHGSDMAHKGIVNDVRFSPDERMILTASDDGAVGIWNASTGESMFPRLPHAAWVKRAIFSGDGRFILAACSDGSAHLWNLDTSGSSIPPLIHPGPVNDAAYSPDGKWIATACDDGLARIWNATTGNPHGQLLIHSDAVLTVAFSPNSQFVVTGSRDKSARVWNVATGKPVGDAMMHSDLVYRVTVSPDARRILTASRDNTAGLWDFATGKSIAKLTHAAAVRFAVFSPDGRHIATASEDSTAQIWDAATGQRSGPPLKHDERVAHASFSPDSQRLVTASYDKTARVWDVATGKPIGASLTHGSWVYQAAFSSDGSRIATAGGDEIGRIWDAATGRPVTVPLAHGNWVNFTSFSPDGRLVVTGSGREYAARVWDAVTGSPVTPLLRHRSMLTSVSSSPDGRRVLTSSDDGSARVWDLATDDRDVNALTEMARLQSATFIDDNGGLLPLAPKTVKSAWQARHRVDTATVVDSADNRRRWHLRQAWEAETEHNWLAAMFHLKQLIDTSTTDASLYLRRAKANDGLQQWHAALADYQRAIELGAEPRQVLLPRGRAHAHARNWEQAIADFTQAMPLTDSPQIWVDRGRAFAETGQWRQAADDLQRAIEKGIANRTIVSDSALCELAAGNAVGYSQACARFLQQCDLEKGSDLDECATLVAAGANAISDFKPMIKFMQRRLNKTECHWWHLLGRVYLRDGNPQEAIATLNTAVEIHQKRGTAIDYGDQLFLALAHHRAGSVEEAKKWLAAFEEKYRVTPVQSWNDRLRFQLLHQEAKQVIR